MKKLLLTSFIILHLFNSFSQDFKWKSKKHLTIIGYNVENLFDTINTPNKNDVEFTPQSKKQWNSERYFKKIESIAQVLSSVNKNELPEIIGLTEVENELPLIDLCNSNSLKAGNYKHVIEDGPDPRGIDCALLYRPDAFTYLNHSAIPVHFPFANNKRTRDILYVKGLVNKDTIHVFINHWSSRRGGQEKSEPKRVQSATVLKETVDSIIELNAQANIVILGDFNDEPQNKSLNTTLGAKGIKENSPLINLTSTNKENNEGTYYYRGAYNMLDNLITNRELINKKKGFRLVQPAAYIYKIDEICYTHKNGDKAPSRTYGGPNYYGGYSDHFPVYTYFYEK